MEERISWGEAFAAAWNNLTGISGEGSSMLLVRVVFFALFVIGTGMAVVYYQEQEELTSPYVEPPMPIDGSASDKQRLDEMLRQIRAASNKRNNSSFMAKRMEDRSNYPFGDPLPTPPPNDEPLMVVIPDVIIDYPPEGIILRAIMITGNQQVALMDIPGVGNGLLVKVGDTFMQRKGRIVRIAPDKVVVRWGGKNWDIAPSF
ncbi:MAG: hypothetical protein LBJ36_12100 [Synergistaceae bacterium]|jgi:Tfp pilus assembly protein PilP|nr:hypothetical protein [Synergistaceae bacterium]